MFKALIVDDEPQIRQGMRTIIRWEDFGFMVAGDAASGAEALELVHELRPEVVITDIKMPQMDGLELAEAIRKCYPDTQILLLSGYNDFVYAKKAIIHGVSNYLLKPVDPEELGQALEAICRQLWDKVQRNQKENEKSRALRDFFLGKLIRGEILGEARDTALKYGVNLQGEAFRLCLIAFDRYDEFPDSMPDREIGLKYFAMKNVVAEILADNGYLFEISDGQFGMLLTDPESARDGHVIRLTETLADCVKQYVKEPITVGIGLLVRDAGEIKASYQEAVKSLQRKYAADSGQGKSENRINEIIELIQQNYMRNINLQELSKAYYINKVYLGQLFKKETGEYFNDYINKIRVRHAYRLLEETRLPIAEIAEKVGYHYVDHFYRWFKMIYGMNPGELRKQTGAGES